MAYSFHKHIQTTIIRKLNALLAVLEVTHISSSSKREERVLLALELPGYRSPVCNLKMYLHCFWSGSGMACKQYCPNSLDFTGRTGKSCTSLRLYKKSLP